MDLDPAGCTCYILSMVFGSPAFDKTHPYSAMLCQFINCFIAMINALRKQLGKLLIIEYFERAARRNFAHCRRMETVVVVAVAALDENGAVA